jgi:hypothetical protein
MSETRLVPGGELAPPPPISDDALGTLNSVIDAVFSDVQPIGWSEEALSALSQARAFLSTCRVRGEDFKLTSERVHEPGAAGPGRGLRVKATWTEKRDQSPRTTVSYPRSLKLPDIIFFVRNMLEHCFRV